MAEFFPSKFAGNYSINSPYVLKNYQLILKLLVNFKKTDLKTQPLIYQNIQFMLEFLKTSFLVIRFSNHSLVTFLMILYVTFLSMLMVLLSTLSDQASDLLQQLELASELESNPRETVNWDRKQLVDFNAGKTHLVSINKCNNSGAINVTMNGSVVEEKSLFKMLGFSFSSKLGWGSYIVSIAKTASKKIGALIRSMTFFSPGVALYLYKSTIRNCMAYCRHVQAGAPSCYLKFQITYDNGYVRQLILHFLPLLNP